MRLFLSLRVFRLLGMFHAGMTLRLFLDDMALRVLVTRVRL